MDNELDALERQPVADGVSQSALIKALGVKLTEAREAAFNAADGNDGVNWELLHELCPAGMDMGQFIDLLCEPGYCETPNEQDNRLG